MARIPPHQSSDRGAPADGLRALAPELVRHTGVGYLPLAFVGRLPFAMMIVGVLTLTVAMRGSVAEAGIVAAAAGLGTAVCGPLSGGLADRVGQRAVLIVSGAVSLVASLALLLVVADAPLAGVAGIAALVGGTTPQVAPFSRSRLVGVSGRVEAPRRERALALIMSYESAADEASFVLGPVLVGALTVAIAPWAPLALAMGLTASVVLAFALHPTARVETSLHGGAAPRTSFLRSFVGEVPLLVLGAGLVGAIFGSILTALTAFMVERDQGELAGVVYGAMSAGAILVALGMAALPRGFHLRARWLVAATVATLACGALVVVEDVPTAAGVLALAGVGVGATLVGLFSLGALAAPAGRATTVLTSVQSSRVVGQALASALGGMVAESVGSQAGFVVTAALAVAVLLVGVVDRLAFGRVTAPA